MHVKNISKNWRGHFGAILEKDISISDMKKYQVFGSEMNIFPYYLTKTLQFKHGNDQLHMDISFNV